MVGAFTRAGRPAGGIGMTISVSVLSGLVLLATTVTVVAPIVLIILWIKDLRKKQLW